MAIIYNWNCNTVDVRPLENGETDVVYNVHWIVTGTSDTLNPDDKFYSATNIGTEMVTVDPSEPFIPFPDLTNDIVVGWTKAAMGDEKVLGIETSIANQIALLINPASITMQLPLPPVPPVPPVED